MQLNHAIFLDMFNFPFQGACEGSEAVTLWLEKLLASEEQRGWSGVSLWQQSVSGRRRHCPLLVITWNRAALKSCRCWPSPWPEMHTDVINSLRKGDGALWVYRSAELITGEIFLSGKLPYFTENVRMFCFQYSCLFCDDDGDNDVGEVGGEVKPWAVSIRRTWGRRI